MITDGRHTLYYIYVHNVTERSDEDDISPPRPSSFTAITCCYNIIILALNIIR